MPRRGNKAKRDVLPDPLYNSKLVTRLINNVMYDGKKGVAQKIVYDAFEIVQNKMGKDPLECFEKSMENAHGIIPGSISLEKELKNAEEVDIPDKQIRDVRELMNKYGINKSLG